MTSLILPPAISLAGLSLELSAQRVLPHSRYPAAWLRGVLGWTLNKMSCVRTQTDCPSCALRQDCAYPQVFKPEAVESGRLPAYVIHHCRLNRDRSRIHFDLIFPGMAQHYAERWIRGLDQYLAEQNMAQSGPGKLCRVRDLFSRQAVFSNGKFNRNAQLNPYCYPSHDIPQRVRISWLTPLVSKHRPTEEGDPLIKPLRTRLTRLAQQYGNPDLLPQNTQQPPWQLLENAMKPCSDRVNGRHVRGQRGHLLLHNISPYGYQLLLLGQYLHAGREISLGFGSYRLQAE
jgi:hypothetical protein